MTLDRVSSKEFESPSRERTLAGSLPSLKSPERCPSESEKEGEKHLYGS